MTSVTLSSKFQLSIPKAVREEMHLKAGQKFAIIPKGDTIILEPSVSCYPCRVLATSPASLVSTSLNLRRPSILIPWMRRLKNLGVE